MAEHPQRTKRVGIALLLTILLGPLGLFYATVLGGVIMLILGVVVLFTVLLTGALSFLFYLVWVLCVVWGLLATRAHNRKVTA